MNMTSDPPCTVTIKMSRDIHYNQERASHLNLDELSKHFGTRNPHDLHKSHDLINPTASHLPWFPTFINSVQQYPTRYMAS